LPFGLRGLGSGPPWNVIDNIPDRNLRKLDNQFLQFSDLFPEGGEFFFQVSSGSF